jgi:hypothetical protein
MRDYLEPYRLAANAQQPFQRHVASLPRVTFMEGRELTLVHESHHAAVYSVTDSPDYEVHSVVLDGPAAKLGERLATMQNLDAAITRAGQASA